MGRQAPDGLLDIHMKLLVTTLAGAMLPAEPEQERAAADAIATFRTSRFGYFLGAGHAAADDRLRPAGFTPRPGGLDARPRHRRRPAGWRRGTPTSPTSMRPVRAATSPPGKSLSCS